MVTLETNIEMPKTLVIGGNAIAENFYDFLINAGHQAMIMNPTDLNLSNQNFDLITIFIEDSFSFKIDVVRNVCDSVAKETLITVNLDSLLLNTLQEHCGFDVLGMNISFPVKASPFMEIIKTSKNSQKQIDKLTHVGQYLWNMDPYVCENISVRAYMLAAMTREALSLVDKGYADIESIDRACRNDAGYYLPFAGNFLYMDLMGTMAYSLVMKDLNSELAKDAVLPEWLLDKVLSGEQGMETLAGFYNYEKGDHEAWKAIVNEFSDDISILINKYKKDYLEG